MSTTPRPTKDTVYVDVDDEITSIIDKVEAGKNKIVALVLPKRASVLQSIVNMRLLKRAADDAKKNVVLITSEQALLPLAGAAGIHVAKNLQSAPEIPAAPNTAPSADTNARAEAESDDEPLDEDDQKVKIDYNKPIGELASAAALDEEAIALDDMDDADVTKNEKSDKPAKKPKDKRLAVPNFEKFRLLIGLGIVAFIGLIVFIIMAVTVLPKATITISTTSIPVSTNFSLTTSDKAKTLDMDGKIIPAQLKTSDQKSDQQVPATGQQNNGAKASGKVTLKNCTSDAVTIPAGTGISSGGLTYITQSTVALSDGNFTPPPASLCKSTGAHVKDVNVVAQTAGEKYNGNHAPYTVSGFSGVSASDSGGMSGGTDSIVTVVSQQDVDKAKQKITSQDSDNFTKQFEAQLSDQGFYVLTPTLKIGDPATTTTPAVGQPASNISVSIKINYSVLVVAKADLESAINQNLSKQIDSKKQKLSNDDVLKNATISVQDQASQTKVTLAISEDTTAIPIIDVQGIKSQVGGKKSGDIKKVIEELPGVKGVDVKMSPFWVSKAPKNPAKITVKLQQVKN